MTYLVIDEDAFSEIGDGIDRDGTVIFVERIVGNLLRDSEREFPTRVHLAEHDIGDSDSDLLATKVAVQDRRHVRVRVPLRHVDGARSFHNYDGIGVLAGDVLDQVTAVIEELSKPTSQPGFRDVRERDVPAKSPGRSLPWQQPRRIRSRHPRSSVCHQVG